MAAIQYRGSYQLKASDARKIRTRGKIVETTKDSEHFTWHRIEHKGRIYQVVERTGIGRNGAPVRECYAYRG